MKKYFANLESYELSSVTAMCEAIESKRLHIVCAGNKFKFLVTGENGYTYDYTFNLCRWGFARKARNNSHLAMLHPYCPNQGIASSLSHFLNTAVEEGVYIRKTNEVFNGGCEFQTIWID